MRRPPSRAAARGAIDTWLAAAAAQPGQSRSLRAVAALRLRGTPTRNRVVAAAARTEALRRLAYAATALSIDGRRCRRALVAWMEAAASRPPTALLAFGARSLRSRDASCARPCTLGAWRA